MARTTFAISSSITIRAQRRCWKSPAAPAAYWAACQNPTMSPASIAPGPCSRSRARRLPHIRLFRQDMTSFHIERRFDAIVCAFDSINHLRRFSDWKNTFRCVARHLNAGGVFVCDVNTTGKLQRLVDGPPWVTQFGRDLAVIRVNGGRAGVFAWDVKIFEHRKGDDYKLIAETIEETAFPMQRILTPLRAYFTEVKVFDPEGARPSDRSERLYFVCKAGRGREHRAQLG